MQKQAVHKLAGAVIGAICLASPAFAFWDSSDVAAEREAWQNALQSLETHGLPAEEYAKAFGYIDELTSEEAAPLVYAVLADLRYGLTRDDLSDAQQDALMKHATHLLTQCEVPLNCLQEYVPQHAQYAPIQKELERYVGYAKHQLWPAIVDGPTLKLGMEDERVADIRNMLRLTGDLPSDVNVSDPMSKAFGATLQKAVIRFQKRHALDADGAVGPKTLRVMQVSPETRIEQMALTLERIRQTASNPEGKHLVVNLPSFTMDAMEGNDKTWRMDVIVGRKDRETPIFSNSITTLEVNPTWTPTHKILSKDLLPKFRNDPEYAVRGGYKVYDRAGGYAVDPMEVDWEMTSASDIRVVQQPGARNALGKVKFMLPDNQAIYLHDTAKRHLFSKSARALSSGCVRLADPEALLAFVLDAQNDAKKSRGERAWGSNERVTIALNQHIPVNVTYYTAFANEEGVVGFYEDIYKKDDGLKLAMQNYNVQYAMREYRLATLPSDAPGLSQYAQNLN